MARKYPVPEDIRALIPEGDHHAPWEELSDGKYLVAGEYALIIASPAGVVDSGLWYEVQYASWQAETHKFTLVWVDPLRPVFTDVTNSENPADLMRVITSRVDRAILTSEQRTLSNGTVVTASVRRRGDGELFSTVIAQGPLPAGGEESALALEDKVRRSVGLE